MLIFICDICNKQAKETKKLHFNYIQYDVCPECEVAFSEWRHARYIEHRGCSNCKHVSKNEHEEPCNKCLRVYKDMFELNDKE